MLKKARYGRKTGTCKLCSKPISTNEEIIRKWYFAGSRVVTIHYHLDCVRQLIDKPLAIKD